MALKVLSYNIRDGGRLRLPAIARLIRRQQPDVVALLEATHRWPVAVLARVLGMEMAFGQANGPFHIAWLSRAPIHYSTNHRLAGLSKTLLEIEIDQQGQPLQLFATHLSGGSDKLHPAQEAPVILERIAEVAPGRHLLVGDFNAIHPEDSVGSPPPSFSDMHDAVDDDPRQAIRSILDAGYVDCFRRCNPASSGYTFPAAAAWLRLDYIFSSPGLGDCLTGCDVVDTPTARRASDHLPVWATFGDPEA